MLSDKIIVDAEVMFVQHEYPVEEKAGSVTVCVDSGVTGGFETALTVSLTAQDGTACELNYVCIYQVILFDSSLYSCV